MASMTTSATLENGRWVIRGQKIWITLGNQARWCYLLARTDPTAHRHRGLSAFIVDMESPGITVRPITTITGSSEFCEIFFDDVAAPEDSLLGDLHQGWAVAMTTLGYERSINFFARAAHFRHEVGEICALASRTVRDGKAVIEDQWIAQRLAQCAEDAEALRLTIKRHLPQWAKTRQPGAESSVIKVMWSEAHQRLMDVALDVLGPAAQQLTDSDAEERGRWPMMYFFTRAESIYAGTSEIQRNVIAQRVLGLPREPKIQ
jgi:alkylation response protein AidB-like acyl-CoA dehydrogenase